MRVQAAKDIPEEMYGTAELQELVEKMMSVMRAAPGVGLAAPQIGVGLRVSSPLLRGQVTLSCQFDSSAPVSSACTTCHCTCLHYRSDYVAKACCEIKKCMMGS